MYIWVIKLYKRYKEVNTLVRKWLLIGSRVELVAQSCPILLDPMDCSQPGSSVHGILQATILEWVVMSFSRGSSQSRDRSCVSCVSCIGRQVLYRKHHLGSPNTTPRYTIIFSLFKCTVLCISWMLCLL